MRLLNTYEAILARVHDLRLDSPLIGVVDLDVLDPSTFDVRAYVPALQASLTSLLLTTPALQEVLVPGKTATIGATDDQLRAATVELRDETDDLLTNLLTIHFDLVDEVPVRVVVTHPSPVLVRVYLVVGHAFTDGHSLFSTLALLLAGVSDDEPSTSTAPSRTPWAPRPQPHDLPSDVTWWHEVTGMAAYSLLVLKQKLFGHLWKPKTDTNETIANALLSGPESYPQFAYSATVPAPIVARLRTACRDRGLTLSSLFNAVLMATAMERFEPPSVTAQTMINLRWHHVPTAGLGGYLADSDLATLYAADYTADALLAPTTLWAMAHDAKWILSPRMLKRAVGRSFFINRHLEAIRRVPAVEIATGDLMAASFVTSNLGATPYFASSYPRGLGVRASRFYYGAMVPFFAFSTCKDLHVTLTSRTAWLSMADAEAWLASFVTTLTSLVDA
ncbi:hypothetical protein SDRG_12962 [Saprolegnia diclina VS20]|uniref:Condensation domain-containing protein n=1 Tax=Saprolegnia diclina (strain VS20) TaxID=1156394 RepID=T0RAR9_SAPDV|nr:hypothetical protein SDRG_12962 [Saprolegnia diclina VS20]EQC29293.1 hypothetical protein SDRG_12962 [Saprolegnia diclina VS20]|eukprot:XP_008617267.1 hypothetical protein SDRG_12962 [Saprolegnia diclina VS20]